MDFGVVLQCDPPAARVVEQCRQAELYGFSHAWTFDSPLLWEEPYVIHSAALAATRKIVVGPMVTNPVTRDLTVTAATYATLNEMYGNRTVCGIGRGDSAVRVTGGKPATVAQLRAAVPLIRGLAGGEEVAYGDAHLRLAWAGRSRTPVWVAAYGPKMLALAGETADGFILQLADPAITAWSIEAVRKAAVDAGRDVGDVTICVAAPAYVTDGSLKQQAHAYDQCRWFGGMVGNHVADIVARYGGEGQAVPKALTDYIAGREGYDYNEHGRAGNTHTGFVPDEIVDRFCLIGSVEHQVERLHELADLGVDQFALYLQHDAQDEVLRAYGQRVIPAMTERLRSRT